MFIRVNNNTWNIRLVCTSDSNLIRSNNTITLGVTDNSLKTVFIADNLSDKMFKKVLSHELVHVYCFEYDYEMDIETEEIVADFISLFGEDIIYYADFILKGVYSIDRTDFRIYK